MRVVAAPASILFATICLCQIILPVTINTQCNQDHSWHDIIAHVLPELHINDTVRLRKPHPCGSYDWKIYRLGADIGLECLGCGRRVMLTRRTLAHRLKKLLINEEDAQPNP